MTESAILAAASSGGGQLKSYSRRKQLVLLAAITAVCAMIPLVVGDIYLQNVLILTLMYAALSQSWNILGGYCGQISLGHALYFGVGAYTATVLFTGFGITPWLGMLVGGVISAILALILGYFCFGLKGHYFAIATMVIAEIGLLIVHNTDALGAALGIQWPIGEDSWWTLQFQSKLPYIYLALALFAITWLATYAIEGSRSGFWWRAIKDDPEAAESLGVEVLPSKLMAAAVSAFFTAIAGSFYAAYVSYIDPDSVMSFRFSLLFALPAVLGGIGTLWGPAVGAAVLIPVTEFTRSYVGGSGNGADLIVYGILIMLVALARPEGLLSFIGPAKRKPQP
ncbi:MAG: branched-chain amino acid ABC transporter permease [Afipia sp.]|nr:branched-chain amino acid ABC transporter permease [Afipia sp.]